MADLLLNTEPQFSAKLAAYPAAARKVLTHLRALVHEVARATPEINDLTETLKWGEPSFVSKKGSTLRMDWKERSPEEYAFYVSCSSQLIPTFRVVFGNDLAFAGNRAILFRLDEPLPEQVVRQCIKAALTYHDRKHLPLLGL